MANTIKLKRASGSDPSASDLSVGELAIRTSNCKLFSKNDGGSAVGVVAGSADTLTTARTIAGVSFDGSGNISLNNNAITNGAGYIADVVSDTSPQLGGDLDVQSSKITTATSNGNVKIEPNGTGVVEVRGAGGNDGKLQLNCSAQSHGIKLASPAHSAGQSYTLIFPDNQIAADKYLKIKSISGSGSTAIGQAEYASLDANDLGEGTIPDARFPSTLPAAGGGNLTDLNATQLTTGTIPTGRFGTDNIATSSIASGTLPSGVAVATANINDDAVTYAKIQNVSATNRILGRDSSGAGVIEEITPANLRTMLNVADGATNVTNTNQLTNGAGFITATLTNEQVQDIVGGMLTGNTETGITVTYQDGDGTIDFVVGTLNQDTTGNAATATALETARNIGGVSFDGTANINLPGVNTAGNQNTTGTSGGFTAGNASNLNSGTLPDARFPSTLPAVDGSNLTGISAGATGGGSDEVFYENDQTVTTNYTITNGKNAMSAGPITINSGVTVTVGSGETLTIV